MKKWENTVIYWKEKVTTQDKAFKLEDALNEFGKEGWEVVSMTHQVDSSGLSDNNGVSSVDTDSIIIVMKREYIEDDSGERFSFE